MDGTHISAQLTHSATVLIIGCGDLGTEAGLRFTAAGYRVVGWRRSPELLPDPIEGVEADLARELPVIPPETEIIILTAAADERTREAYEIAYSGAVERLVHALNRDGVTPERVLFVSSTTVYSDDDGSVVDESTPAVPGSETGRAVREAERLLHARLPGSVVLRLAGIYGPGRTRLIDQVRSGSAELPANPRMTNRIHRDDAAAAIVHLTTTSTAPEPIYVGVDNEPVDLREVLEFLASRLGQELFEGTPSERSRGGNKRCSNALLRASGFEFIYPTYREGYNAILAGEGERHG
ncbi:NAD-dependent epimerase/dehydratase family protein [Arthrobacter roseus]|uniref:NAD-dependent epimerase/dehydratase family protein n=1 Tax=Arthrobacter roseus TaxID=136274 RepID=UPI0019656C08|nr:NAD-dependent epimerase/dehydratase family protein [Arthrobacter roseus]MBM7849426.1 nucleoside-diphosphate-sugar epimerase [Arthrobacter roseus]